MQTSSSFIEAGLSILQRSLQDRASDLRNIQLATISADGYPRVRTLVLRVYEQRPACAEMHSDARAAKVDDIAATARVSLLAWSAADHLQLRFDGLARLHRDDDVAHARWEMLSSKARDAYGSQARPGTPIEDPEGQAHLSPAEQFQQFTVIRVALDSVDILQLEPEGGQKRAHGRFTSSGVTTHWIGP